MPCCLHCSNFGLKPRRSLTEHIKRRGSDDPLPEIGPIHCTLPEDILDFDAALAKGLISNPAVQSNGNPKDRLWKVISAEDPFKEGKLELAVAKVDQLLTAVARPIPHAAAVITATLSCRHPCHPDAASSGNGLFSFAFIVSDSQTVPMEIDACADRRQVKPGLDRTFLLTLSYPTMLMESLPVREVNKHPL